MQRLLFTSIICLAAGFLITCTGMPEESSVQNENERISIIDRNEAMAYPGFEYMGEYSGLSSYDQEDGPVATGLQVAVYGENRFRGMLWLGGLPGENLKSDGTPDIIRGIPLEGTYEDHVFKLQGVDEPVYVRKIHEHYAILDEHFNYLGHVTPVERTSSTAGMAPPQGARHLFSGQESDLQEYWEEGAEMENGLMVQGGITAHDYGDIRIHAEAKLGFMPDTPMPPAAGRTNSGFYIQNRYEVQIIDSFALYPDMSSNGSLYNEVQPLFNPTFPPLAWQTYDIYFRAPRFDDQGEKTENARITVYLNGFLVVDDAELERGTGAGGQRGEVERAFLYLQDHTGEVRFRNVWLVEDEYSPPGVPVLESNTPPAQIRY